MPVASPEIHLVFRFVPDRDAPPPRSWTETLDDEELRRLGEFIVPRSRRPYAAAHDETRRALSRLAGGTIPPRAWRFVRDPRGRPGLAAPFADRGWDFNLSHTTGLVAVAVATSPGIRIGVDVERVAGRERDYTTLARRFWSGSEADAVTMAPDPDARRSRFLALWTLKESRAKATGKGLAGGGFLDAALPCPALADTDTDTDTDAAIDPDAPPPRLREETLSAPGWRYRSFRLTDDAGAEYWAAAAADVSDGGGGEPDWRIRVVRGDEPEAKE